MRRRIRLISKLSQTWNVVSPYCPRCPTPPSGTRWEIEMQLALGMSSIRVKGMISPAVRQAYERAGEIAQKSGDERHVFQSLYGVWQHNVGSGRIVAARPLAERLLSVTGHGGADPGLCLQAHHAVWTTSFIGGEPVGCLEHCEIGRRRYDPERYQSHRDLYGGHDAGVCAWMFGGQAEWLLGRADTALASLTEAVRLAERISHPPSLVGVLCYAAMLQRASGRARIGDRSACCRRDARPRAPNLADIGSAGVARRCPVFARRSS